MMEGSKQLATLQERIAERVGKDLLELIPEDQWKDLVSSQVDHFIKHLAPKVIQDELRTKMIESIREALNGPEYAMQWNQHGRLAASDAVKKLFIDGAPEILASMFEPALMNAINQLRNNAVPY